MANRNRSGTRKSALTDDERLERRRKQARESSRKYRERNPDTVREYQASNRDKARERNARWRAKNKESERLRFREYRLANLERLKEKNRAYIKANRAKMNAHWAKRKAVLLRATPDWADLDEIERIYKTCPEGHHVDHIYPLVHERLCGLHVPCNLQHLPASENLSKGNRIPC